MDIESHIISLSHYGLHLFLFQQLVLFVGAKLQHVIATLVLENAGITEYASGVKLRPRDELFWFNKPELLLSLIHFIQFQVCKILSTSISNKLLFFVDLVDM